MTPHRSTVRLVWHRRDLRLCDNELYTLTQASVVTTKIVSLYVIDPKDFTPRPCSGGGDNWRSVTIGPHATRVLLNALMDLRQALCSRGGQLLVRHGDPLQVVPSIAREVEATDVVWSEDVGYYEYELSQRMKTRLQSGDITFRVQTVSGYSLYHPDDLPRDEQTWSRMARPKERVCKKGKGHNPQMVAPCLSNNLRDASQDHHSVDLRPERFTGMPPIMGDFRRAVRTSTQIRPCLVAPTHIQSIPGLEAGVIPTFEELTGRYRNMELLGLPSSCIDSIIDHATPSKNPGTHHVRGGEIEAYRALEIFLHDYAATADRSSADVSNYRSPRLSTPLSVGSMSPRQVYWAVKAYIDTLSSSSTTTATTTTTMTTPDTTNARHDNSHWLIDHLEIRDYFIFSTWRASTDCYQVNGTTFIQQPRQSSKNTKNHHTKRHIVKWRNPGTEPINFSRWAMGRTGLPLIDAGMRELSQTGYCSNRVRQNMASLLSKDLQIDWRVGAEWFQFCLEDHCVAANWGNWMYFAGVGCDPKNRHFRTLSQASRYDPEGQYVEKWIPILRLVPHVEMKLRPWDFSDIVRDWPYPIVDPQTQYTWIDRQRLEQTGQLSVSRGT